MGGGEREMRDVLLGIGGIVGSVPVDYYLLIIINHWSLSLLVRTPRLLLDPLAVTLLLISSSTNLAFLQVPG